MSNNALYLKAAQDLRRNVGQWNAYESGGHCVVLAGPGSGKTKTLTIKLARLLAEDILEPRGVACITYNNESARELETRLKWLGIEPSRRVFIGTVHSFSLTQIIMPYSKVAKLELPDEFKIATRKETAIALEWAFKRAIGGPENPQKFSFSMNKYRREILDRNSPEWHTNRPELAHLVEAYEEKLRAMNRIDFDDMPLLAVQALRKNKWLRKALLAKYPVLVVDEYQDLGQSLHQIVMRLCFGAGMRLFAVGDVDQSIYSFTGAHPELLQQLSERSDVETVHLRLNYRSGTQIVAASSYVLGEERDYEAAEGAEEGTIYFHPLPNDYTYHANHFFSVLLPEIQKRHPELAIGDIAILYQAAWIGDEVANVAQAYDIPTIRTDGNSLYPRSSRLLYWFEQCAEWCCGGWKTGAPRFKWLVKEGARLFAEELDTEDKHLTFQKTLMSELWSRRDSTILLHHWLEELSEDLINPLIENCRTISDETNMLFEFIEKCQTGNCKDMTLGDFSGQGEGKNCIKLSTLHSSKGREFRIVIMFGIDNYIIPRKNLNKQGIVEARRLFYVGFTRAKSELHIMYTEHIPSPFIIEVKHRLETGRKIAG